MTDRIPLGQLNSDQLNALYEQMEAAEDTEAQRQLATAREALASASSRAARMEHAAKEAEAQLRLTDAMRQQHLDAAAAAIQRAEQAEAALDRVRAIHTHGPRTNTCNDCGQPWPCEVTRALDDRTPATAATRPAVRRVHVTITNPDEYTANRAALSLADWIRAEFPGHQVATDAREWDEPAPAEEQQ